MVHVIKDTRHKSTYVMRLQVCGADNVTVQGLSEKDRQVKMLVEAL